MNIKKIDILDNFLERYNAADETKKPVIRSLLNEVNELFGNQETINFDTLVISLLQSTNKKMAKIINESQVIPGYDVKIDSNNMSYNLYGGYKELETNTDLKQNSLFDLASISKLFPQIIAYNLIEKKQLDPDKTIKETDDRFVNLDQTKIGDLMEYTISSYKTEGNILSSETSKEALNKVYNIEFETGSYTYMDFGMIVLKEVLERVTNSSYEELIREYIVKPTGAKDIKLSGMLTREEIKRVTGTPNLENGLNNDAKANVLGGTSGHSGIFATTKEVNNILLNLYANENFFPQEKLPDVYTESSYSMKEGWYRGIMGNACVFGGGFVGENSPENTAAFQGSTRVVSAIGTYNEHDVASSIFLNPASMGMTRRKEKETEINKKLSTFYKSDDKSYEQLAAQVLIPKGVMTKLSNEVSDLNIKLRYVHELLFKTNPLVSNYTHEVNLENGKVR